MGHWYQTRWGNRVKLLEDQASKENFATAAGGFRLATSMGGATLGRGGDIKILDDPNSVQQAESDIEREQAIRTYDEALATRETDPSTAAEVIIMQRLHERDIAGHVLDTNRGDLVHLMLPMEFDERRACRTRWGRDPRTEDGELLWPEQFPREVVEDRKRRLGPYAASGQLQQTPVTRGGNIVKREWWRLWPEDYPESGLLDPIFHCRMCGWHIVISGEAAPEIECRSCGSVARRHLPFPEFSYRLLSVDTAYGEKQENSWSAATAWGIWHDKEGAPRAMLTDAWRGRPRLRGAPDSPNPSVRMGLVERIYHLATKNRVDVVLIRTVPSGSGSENISDVLLQHVKVLAVDQFANERQETPTVVRAVTLEVNTDQAQKILLATNVGKLSLILRQAGESNPVAAQRVTERDLARIEPIATPAPVVAAPSRSATVSIIRNMKREEYSVMRSN